MSVKELAFIAGKLSAKIIAIEANYPGDKDAEIILGADDWREIYELSRDISHGTMRACLISPNGYTSIISNHPV